MMKLKQNFNFINYLKLNKYQPKDQGFNKKDFDYINNN